MHHIPYIERYIWVCRCYTGTLAGIVLSYSIGGYPLPEGVYGSSYIPVVIRIEDVLSVISVVFLLNMAAGIYPAQKAANLDPLEAISTR